MTFLIDISSAYGSYCFKDNIVPFCPKDPDSIGDQRCCVGAQQVANVLDDISFRGSNSIETMVDTLQHQERS